MSARAMARYTIHARGAKAVVRATGPITAILAYARRLTATGTVKRVVRIRREDGVSIAYSRPLTLTRRA